MSEVKDKNWFRFPKEFKIEEWDAKNGSSLWSSPSDEVSEGSTLLLGIALTSNGTFCVSPCWFRDWKLIDEEKDGVATVWHLTKELVPAFIETVGAKAFFITCGVNAVFLALLDACSGSQREDMAFAVINIVDTGRMRDVIILDELVKLGEKGLMTGPRKLRNITSAFFAPDDPLHETDKLQAKLSETQQSGAAGEL